MGAVLPYVPQYSCGDVPRDVRRWDYQAAVGSRA
jgi:hypothetical protein